MESLVKLAPGAGKRTPIFFLKLPFGNHQISGRMVLRTRG